MFSLLIQCLKCAFETWLGKIANAPGQLSQWATDTEPEWPRACDLHQEKHRIEKPVHCNYRVAPARWKYRSPEQQWRPATAGKSLQSSSTLCVPIDGSPPGSPVHGILQARTVEWVAISFSNEWKWKLKVKLFSRVWPSATLWTAAFQAPLFMVFSRQEYWSECHCLLHNEDLMLPKLKKKKNSPRETSEVSGEAGHEKGWNQAGSDIMQVMEREATACFHSELGI